MKTMNVARKFYAVAAAGATALVASPAFAQIDVSAAVADIGDAKDAALLIGAAVLGVAIAIALYKWVRRAV